MPPSQTTPDDADRSPLRSPADGRLIDADREVSLMIRAKMPLINIASYEESRVMEQLGWIREDVIWHRQAVAREELKQTSVDLKRRERLEEHLDKLGRGMACPVIRWSVLGLDVCRYEPPAEPSKDIKMHLEGLQLPAGSFSGEGNNPLQLLHFLRNPPSEASLGGLDLEMAFFVFCDLHPWLERQDPASRFNHTLVRALRDLAYSFRGGLAPRTIILLGPRTSVPQELAKEVQVIDYPLPTRQQLATASDQHSESIKKKYGADKVTLSPQEKDSLVQALQGLTLDEAGDVVAKTFVRHQRLGADAIKEALAEKRQIIRKEGLLEFIEHEKSLSDVGGLELLTKWLDQRKRGFEGGQEELEEKKIDLPVPKGVLLIGVPGGGKSLIAKAVAKSWEKPLLRLDVGRLFGSYIGQSEENMRRAIKVAEGVSPAILWLDEIEKAFPRASGSQDSGTSLRVLNTFLTWMQEKKAAVFVVATGNDISQLPTELTRKGRFDEIFYVGLPDKEARKKIFKILLQPIGVVLDEDDLELLGKRTRWFTGAEIEQSIANGLYLVKFVRTLHQQPYEPKHLLARAIAHFLLLEDGSLPKERPIPVPLLLPLAMRRTQDGRGLVAQTLEQAKAFACPASLEFEEPPKDGEPRREGAAPVQEPRVRRPDSGFERTP